MKQILFALLFWSSAALSQNEVINPTLDMTGGNGGGAQSFALGVYNNGPFGGIFSLTDWGPSAVITTWNTDLTNVVLQLIGGIEGSKPYTGHVLEVQDNMTGIPTMYVVNDGTVTAKNLILLNVPTHDPHITGALWNSNGTLKISK